MTPPPFDTLSFCLIVGFIIGLALGSFITMLSYRLPRRYSIIQPGSFCPSCFTLLGVRDLVPVFSWLRSNGRCRYCREEINVRYPLIELATGVSCAAAVGLLGFSFWLIPALIVIVAIIAVVVMFIERDQE